MGGASLLLERLGALMQQCMREDAARHGLLPIQLQVLHYLSQANRYSDFPIAVADYFGVTRGTVSQTVGVLERKGLLAKVPDGRHGRRIHLELTAAGEAVIANGWAERVESALRAGDHGREVLSDALRSILMALQRQNGQKAFGVCHDCAHFLRQSGGARCGLTGEPLAEPQTRRICREWSERLASSC